MNNYFDKDVFVPEHKKDDYYYLKKTRFYAEQYNIPIFPANSLQNEGSGIQSFVTPVQEMNENYLIYFGHQDNSRNYFVGQDNDVLKYLNTDNNVIFTLVNSLHGKIVNFTSRFSVSTDLLSTDAQKRKNAVREHLLYMVDNMEFYQELQKLGIQGNAMPENFAIKTREDVEEYMEYYYQEYGAYLAEEISLLSMRLSMFQTLKPDQFLDLVIAGVTGSYREVRNGLVYEGKYRPQELILDLRSNNDNNFNDAAWFRGGFKMLSYDEMIEIYGDDLREDQKKEMLDCAKSTMSGFGENYVKTISQTTTGYFNWYTKSDTVYNPINAFSAVEMYWFDLHDNRYYNTKKGSLKYKDYRDNGEPIDATLARKGDYIRYRLYKGVLLGGRWLCQCGLVPNAVYNPITKRQQFPISVYIDNYSNGYYKSRVGRMKGLQLDINLTESYIKQAEIDNLGVNYLISDVGSDGKKTIQSIFANFKRIKMDMFKRDIDDDQVEIARQQFVQQLDFTKSLSVVNILLQIKADYIKTLQNMMHLPEAAQGLQNTVIGKGVQQTTVALAAEGIAPLFNGFVNFMQRDLQFDVNMQKVVWLKDEKTKEIAINFIGTRGYNWLETATLESFEYLGIFINPYDTIDTERRKELDAKLMIYAQQQQGLTPLEDLTLSQISSYRKAIAYLRMGYKRKEQAAIAANQQARQDAEIAMAAANETALQAKQIPADAVVQSKVIQNQGEDRRTLENNATKERNTKLEQQVKLLTKQIEQMGKKEEVS